MSLCRGAGLSIALSTSLAPVFLVVYIKWRKLYPQTWGGWSFESLTEWWQFLRLGLPGLLMLGFEWWSFEISSIVVGTIDDTQLAICGVLLLYGNMIYEMVRVGVFLLGVCGVVRDRAVVRDRLVCGVVRDRAGVWCGTG